MTTDEMRAARARGETRSDFERLRSEASAGIEPALGDDSPDASALMKQMIAKRRAGRPLGSGTKEQVALRLDHDVLAAFRAGGAGWQTRINAALREWIEKHPYEAAARR